MDGDGDLDLAVGNQGENQLYRNEGADGFKKVPGALTGALNTNSVAWGDMDGDGDLDLAVGTDSGVNRIYKNYRQGRLITLPNNTPALKMTGVYSATADFYASSQVLTNTLIPFSYTLFDSLASPVGQVKVFYSQNGGDHWQPAQAASGTVTTNLATSPHPTATITNTHVYTWDTFASGFFGQSDNVVMRLVAYSQPPTGTISGTYRYPNAVAGPYQWAYAAASTFPFRVRGTQVRVLSGTTPISNALVYRLPAGQTSGGSLIADDAGNPFRTDEQGYLQGHGQIDFGDQLLALVPVDWTESITWGTGLTSTMHLYYTNGTPTESGLETFTVSQSGVQELVVSPNTPLMLFDLHVSLEWDAHNDPLYLQQLAFDLEKASEYLYDFTNGQVALGRVDVFQRAEAWAYSEVVVQATNRMRPFAVQGGIVISPTIDPEHSDIVYNIGQIRMGATWNRYGNPGQNLGADWPLALAHELSHYFFFLDDTYLGLNDDDLLIPVDTCTGSVMGDMYDPSGINTEFLDAADWLTPSPKCANTLAHKTLERSEWETIRLWYPWLEAPTTTMAGPGQMPFAFTTINILDPLTPTNTLEDPTFYLDYAGSEVSTSEARAFLFRNQAGTSASGPDEYEYVYDLGNPVGGQNRLLARGAQPGDRLCVFDQARYQYGCEVIASEDEWLAMEKDISWRPVVQISPVNSTTFTLQVEGLSSGLSLKARLYPEFGEGFAEELLTEAGGVYSGTLNLPYPALNGDIQLWVDETAGESNPRRETVVGYSIGGNPGFDRGGSGFDRGGSGFDRGGSGFDRGGSGFDRGGSAPVVSSDGQMIFFDNYEISFEEGQFYTVQNMAGLPQLPAGKSAIGQGYNLLATGFPAGTPVLTGSISFQYQGVDVLVEGVDENQLTIHFWQNNQWHALETIRDTYYNLASAPSQGPGVYVLLAGVTIPNVSMVTPSAATNQLTRTIEISGGYFMEPLAVTLVGPTARYTLPVQTVSPYTITAVVTQGLTAREYQVFVSNNNQPGGPAVSPTPGIFALYDPADACFYDFFESGASQWQRDGAWDIVTIVPGGERAMTDSPGGPYKSAGDYGEGLVTYTTAITSVPINLTGCFSNPVLTFRHDYVLAQFDTSQDVARVEISTNDGLTWTELIAYTGGGIYGLGTQDVESSEWAGVTWQDVELSLNDYTGPVRLRFSLTVDQPGSDKGWIFDNVMINSGSSSSPGDGDIFLPIILKE
jgi:hypothetical protein